MSDQQTAAPQRPTGKDRFGLRPAGRGRVRGRIQNLRRGFEIGEFGQLTVIEFELEGEHGTPPVPVRMTGTIFNDEPHDGLLVEVRDPDPSARPIETWRLDLPHHRGTEIVAFYPGRNEPPPSRQWLLGALVILAPIAVAAVLLGVFFAYGR